jgi:putative transcriptional regulator
MSELFDDMMSGLNDAEAFLAGKEKGRFRVHVPEKVNVKRIREKLHMTQGEFSTSFGFSRDAVKHWETGRRTPEAPSRAYLMVISKNPGAVFQALAPSGKTAGAKHLRTNSIRAAKTSSAVKMPKGARHRTAKRFVRQTGSAER